MAHLMKFHLLQWEVVKVKFFFFIFFFLFIFETKKNKSNTLLCYTIQNI